MIAVGAGLCCPVCGSSETGVLDSRPYLGGIRRRRQCPKCGYQSRFSTVEVPLNLKKGRPRSMSVSRMLDLVDTIDKFPAHKREIVLTLIAAFVADEADREPLEGR